MRRGSVGRRAYSDPGLAGIIDRPTQTLLSIQQRSRRRVLGENESSRMSGQVVVLPDSAVDVEQRGRAPLGSGGGRQPPRCRAPGPFEPSRRLEHVGITPQIGPAARWRGSGSSTTSDANARTVVVNGTIGRTLGPAWRTHWAVTTTAGCRKPASRPVGGPRSRSTTSPEIAGRPLQEHVGVGIDPHAGTSHAPGQTQLNSNMHAALPSTAVLNPRTSCAIYALPAAVNASSSDSVTPSSAAQCQR